MDKAILDFNKWMKDIVTKHNLVLYKTNSSDINGNTALMTWSDWDFGVCLKKECSRKRIKKPTYFDQWIDLRALYRVNILFKNFLTQITNKYIFRNITNIVHLILVMLFRMLE